MSLVSVQSFIQSNGVKLAVYQWGEQNRENGTIVLVHGYPDSAEVWQKVAGVLASKFHVVAYDVRGTGASSKPKSKKDYCFPKLVQDLSTVINTVSPQRRVHLVGHDWGALQCWEAVLDDKLKHQVRSYVALAPSLDHVGWWFKRQLQQKSLTASVQVLKRAIGSSYMGLMLLPKLPELTWYLGLFRIWPILIARLERTEVSTDPAQLTNAVNGIELYRQNLVMNLANPSTRKTSIPINMLMMSKDPFAPQNLCQGMQEWAATIEYNQIAAGHWGILSHPEQIAVQISNFILRYN
ncbi:alpha/beta fold hydrolase [Acinetobacter baumannii]|uniref:alpha/beta fold hydrolase n=1 Tax=Acinetobacter baumannii TaxID=470 RepID=UPI00321A41A8